MIEVEFATAVTADSSLERAWQQLLNLKDARFFDLPSRAQLWQRSQTRADEIREGYDVTYVVGIGGSSLGGRALRQAFGRTSEHRIEFIEAPDETSAAGWSMPKGRLNRVHFVFISKSGKTLETLALLDYWSQTLKQNGLELARQATVICGPADNPLLEWARTNGVPTLDVPEDVGGRFSVLTPVGLLPAALMGVPVSGLRAGAAWALSQKDLVLRLATGCLQDLNKQKWITQMWVYSDAFSVLGLWWQQLWSESLAKKVARSGQPGPRVSTPMVCVGPQDQHSLLQQLQEGIQDKSVILLRDLQAEGKQHEIAVDRLKSLGLTASRISLGEILRAEADGFQGALREAGVPHFVLKTSSSRSESWGAFFMIWELVVGVMGEHLGINAFDQPGVELGKRLALESLRRRL